MTREVFTQELGDLNIEVVKMATGVVDAIENAVRALSNRDKDLAQQIIDGDDRFDELEADIERKCVELIAMQQPIASDLRLITAILKLITDLERIADHAADISLMTLAIADKGGYADLDFIMKMGNLAQEMLKNTVDAYVNHLTDLAEKVCDSDNQMDQMYQEAIDFYVNCIKNDTANTYVYAKLMFVVKYLEKIGDHVTNIAEWVIYHVTGARENLN